MSSHVVIAGTGRTGTTFLVKLLTNLGLDTGFKPYDFYVFKEARAGLEINLLKAHSPPYIVKDPAFFEYVEEVLDDEHLQLDCVILPMRDLQAAAESRRQVEKSSHPGNYKPGHAPGGLIGADGASQEAVLQEGLYRLMLSLSRANVPVILLHYPTLLYDRDYLYSKLKGLFPGTDCHEFSTIFDKTVDPGLINTLSANDRPGAKANQAGAAFQPSLQKPIALQLYADYGEGFNEKNSQYLHVDRWANQVDFALDADRPIIGLRFDPALEPCILRLDRIVCRSSAGAELACQVTGHNAVYHEDERYYFTTNDPQIFVAINGRARVCTVMFEILEIGHQSLAMTAELLGRKYSRRGVCGWIQGFSRKFGRYLAP